MIGLLACVGEAEVIDSGPEALDSTPADVYGTELQPIWNEHCIRCHGSGMTSVGLDLTLDSSELIDVASSILPEMVRVSPGSPEGSMLWHKLMGTHLELAPSGMGERMPQSEEPLDADQLALIEGWIQGL